MKPQWENSRGVRERVFIEGELVLDTPTHIGSGEGEGLTDMPLLLHETDNLPLLMGSSIAGALRSYLENVGFREEASKIFGDNDNGKSYPSIVFIDDSFGHIPDDADIELRDGVAISLETMTAVDKAKFDMELLPAGTRFPLSFEFLVLEKDGYSDTFDYFGLALKGLQEGKISFGMRKRRGFGRCHAENLKIYRYDMSKPEGLIGWLEKNKDSGVSLDDLPVSKDISLVETNEFVIEASFEINSSLLMRSKYVGENDPDSVHIHSYRNGNNVPVISGTGLAGALRARAYKIVNTIGVDTNIVNNIFGTPREEKENRSASRLWVSEGVVVEPKEIVQNRIRIDRLTGGAYAGALFNEQPIFGGRVKIKLVLERPEEKEIGLLLLLLKDIWTSDLPIGGGASVGRGRLNGIEADLYYKEENWHIEQEGERLVVDHDADKLESFVQALWGDR